MSILWFHHLLNKTHTTKKTQSEENNNNNNNNIEVVVFKSLESHAPPVNTLQLQNIHLVLDQKKKDFFLNNK